MRGPAVELTPGEHHEGDTRQWLLRDIMPILDRELAYEIGTDNPALLQALAELVGKYRDSARKWRHLTVQKPKRAQHRQ